MASRWAFEASMVAQYKDNAFEKEFYLFDKMMSESDYKKIYFIPQLESKLDFVNLYFKNQEPEIRSEVIKALDLVRNEISGELKDIGTENFKNINDLTIEKYDSSVYSQTISFIDRLEKYYVKRYNKADVLKDNKVGEMTSSIEKEKKFESFRNAYQNEAITELVKNTSEAHRIIEQDGKFVQKIYPIYKDPDPDHMVDFDAQFYMPYKHFLNRNIDTYYFNLGVIWFMTLLLVITLYFEVLRKIVDGLGNISNPIPKRM
jgi:hypothetical protein